MVNSGETAHLSCSVQAIFFTITILKIIMTSDYPFPKDHHDLGLDCPALQDSAEKHSVIWRNAAGDEVQQDGRSPLSNWQILDCCLEDLDVVFVSDSWFL